VTVVAEQIPMKTHDSAGITAAAAKALAPWHIRFYAWAVDVVPALAVVATMALVSLSVPDGGLWWWVCISLLGLAVLALLVNRLLLPVVLGWSFGRALCGIAVVRRDGAAVGAWGLLLRDLAHLLDTVSVVGWLWPLWDSQRRTFADMLMGTEVRRVEQDVALPKVRQWTAVAVLTAAGLCVVGAGIGYTVVYSRDQATDQTRAQIATQGPKIVAQMLTYDPKSLHDDFARAQSLATAKYRGQLATQQDIVQKGNPVVNEYWVTDSSILAASPDRATMLLFMQGRRGVAPEERYITATVRVSFAEEGSTWRVDDLTVLTRPKQPGSGK
jgi:Mce-associated membrane protein